MKLGWGIKLKLDTKNVKGKIPFKKVREMAWEKAVCIKERKRKKGMAETYRGKG